MNSEFPGSAAASEYGIRLNKVETTVDDLVAEQRKSNVRLTIIIWVVGIIAFSNVVSILLRGTHG